jgi:hypothetical protein
MKGGRLWISPATNFLCAYVPMWTLWFKLFIANRASLNVSEFQYFTTTSLRGTAVGPRDGVPKQSIVRSREAARAYCLSVTSFHPPNPFPYQLQSFFMHNRPPQLRHHRARISGRNPKNKNGLVWFARHDIIKQTT